MRFASRRSTGIEARSAKRSPTTRSADAAAATKLGDRLRRVLAVGVDDHDRLESRMGRERRVDSGPDGRALAERAGRRTSVAPTDAAAVELPGDGRRGAVVDEDDRADLGADAARAAPVEGTSSYEGITATTRSGASGVRGLVSTPVPRALPRSSTSATRSALAIPSAVPATVSNGKCAPKSTRVKATRRRTARGAGGRGEGDRRAGRERGGDRHVAARERVQVRPRVALEDDLAGLEDLLGPRAVVHRVDGLEQAPGDDGGAEHERRDARGSRRGPVSERRAERQQRRARRSCACAGRGPPDEPSGASDRGR